MASVRDGALSPCDGHAGSRVGSMGNRLHCTTPLSSPRMRSSECLAVGLGKRAAAYGSSMWNAVAGAQQLRIHRRLSSPNGAAGSHREFWDFFYDAVASIAAWAPNSLAIALRPVNGDFAWQIADVTMLTTTCSTPGPPRSCSTELLKQQNSQSLSGPLQLQFEASDA